MDPSAPVGLRLGWAQLEKKSLPPRILGVLARKLLRVEPRFVPLALLGGQDGEGDSEVGLAGFEA